MIIYLAKNKTNGMVYIGQTTETLKKRVARHMRADSLFGRALRKYGMDGFEISQIDFGNDRADLDAKESRWIAEYNCMHPNGYNLTAGGGGATGYTFSEEGRAKLRAAKAANPLSPEGRERMRQSRLGKTLSDESKRKVGDAQRGRKRVFSEEHRRNLSEANRRRVHASGWKQSEEVKAHLREINLGRTISVEARQKISETLRSKSREAAT